MAGIYIPGMDMLTEITKPTWVVIHPDADAVVYPKGFERPYHTKAIPVPAHGRLIDADTFKRELVLDYAYAAADMVDDAPIIILVSEESTL